MSSVIKISIIAAAGNAVAGMSAAGKSAQALEVKIHGADRALKSLDGRNAKVSISASGLTTVTAQIEAVAAKMALVTGGALALTGASLPLVGAVTALGAAFGAAGAGLGLFGAVAIPTITAVTDATKEYNTASHAYDRAISLGDTKAAATAAKNMSSALAVLNPQQREAANSLLGLQDAFNKLSQSSAPTVLAIINQAAGALNLIIPQLAPAISAMGAAIKTVSGQAFTTLIADVKPIVDLIVTQGVPAFKSLAAIGQNLFTTGLNLTRAFAPLGNTILTLIVGVTSSLSRFDFTPIVSFVQNLLPTMASLLSNVGGLFVTIVKAAAPLAGPVLTAISDIAVVLGKAFASTDIKEFVSNLVGIVGAVAPIVSVVLPVFTTFANLLSKELLATLKILAPTLPVVAGAITSILQAVAPLIPVVATLASILLTGLAGAIQTLLPALTPLLTALGPALISIMTALTPVLIPVANALFGILSAVTPLIPSLASIITQVISGIIPVFVALAPVITQIASAFGDGLLQVITALMPVLPILLDAFQQMFPPVLLLLQTLTPLIPLFAGLASTVITALIPALQFLVPQIVAVLNPLSSVLGVVDKVFDITPAQIQPVSQLQAGVTTQQVVHNWTVNVPVSSDPASVGREIRDALAAANRVDGLG